MSIRRAIPVVMTEDLDASRAFYVDFLGFEPAMDEPGFLMLRSPTVPTTQVIVATTEAADAKVAMVDVSIEVADVDAAYARAAERRLEVVHPITDEPWGVRRFFVRDPSGKVINVASHAGVHGMIGRLYDAFNRRDIDAVLVHLTEDVTWANGMEGGHVHGHDGLRDYWERQFAAISPQVVPNQIAEDGDRVVVEVRQTVRSLDGTEVLGDEDVRHAFTLAGDGRIARFDIVS